MSPAEIAARADRLAATVAGEPAYGHTRDVVVVHNGRVVRARHFGDASADELVDTYSDDQELRRNARRNRARSRDAHVTRRAGVAIPPGRAASVHAAPP